MPDLPGTTHAGIREHAIGNTHDLDGAQRDMIGLLRLSTWIMTLYQEDMCISTVFMLWA